MSMATGDGIPGGGVAAGAAGAPPGGRRAAGGPWWWARPRGLVLDVLLAVVAALECGWGAAGFAGDRLHWHAPVPAVAFVLGALAGASLVVRRRWPVVPVAAALVFVPGMVGVVLLVVSLYTLAACRDWRARRWTVAALSALAFAETLGMVLVAFLSDPQARGVPPRWLLVVLAVLVSVGLTVPPMVLGLYVGARRRLVESLRDRAEGLEAELGLLAEQARERARRARMEERTRIAREMHDVVAHRVSLMVVHAGALERVVPRDPQRAAESARLMGEVGRQALDELRQILGVLRMAEGEAAGAGAGAPPAAVRAGAAAGDGPDGPDAGGRGGADASGAGGAGADGSGGCGSGADGGPGLADVPRLVEQSRAAGLPARLEVGGARRAFTAEAERTAYRVVQEALTNAHKHARGAEALVTVAYVPNGVRVVVVNTAPCEQDAADGGRPLPSGGNGLVGMRERVAALGGSFAAGPVDGGGFRVEAVLPSRLAVSAVPLRRESAGPPP
ncbi:sensor histidine kinase [Streptomyces sp. NPDC001380]|uniref:sensor histidine kinase n=1 Tax=Streptomyces sp. NPDC001380 TaxID=3364566 RepID=UPI003685DCD1